MKSSTFYHVSFVMLILLSLLGTWLSGFAQTSVIIQIVITITVIVKGQQIVDIFMELYNAPTKWRRFMLSYVVLMPSLLLLITLV